MTPQKAQQIVDEVRAVLARHSAALVGSCENEGIYGEITIMDAEDVPLDGRVPLDSVIRPQWRDQMMVQVIVGAHK